MAVSGRKFSDLKYSVARGSAENCEHRCDPCSTAEKHIEAHGFCVECEEYLCKICYECHLRTKASRNHQLVESDKIDNQTITIASKDTEECTDICQVHKKEIIKFFCVNHEALGCNDCMTMQHRTCTLVYIPDKCVGIGDSAEYNKIVRGLDRTLNEAETLTEKAVETNTEIESSYTDIVQKISKFRQEINDRLDQLQDKILTDARNLMASDKQKIERVLESCTSIISDVKNLQSSLNDMKLSNQSTKLYVAMKRALSSLKSVDTKLNEEAFKITEVQYEFERDNGLENLSRQQTFGRVDRCLLKTDPVSRNRNKNKAKLCTITKWESYPGFGFVVSNDPGEADPYVKKVIEDSPAEAAGLEAGDRIVEIQGSTIKDEDHDQVIRRIQAAGSSLTVLLIGTEAETYYKEMGIVVSSKMPDLIRLENPKRVKINKRN